MSEMAHWVDATLASIEEISGVTLQEAPVSLDERTDSAPADLHGAWVGLVSGDVRVEVGIASDRTGCENLSRLLLYMEPDEPLADEDISDAMGELANMLAGGVKSELAGIVPGLMLGLPVFLTCLPAGRHETGVAKVTIGESETWLIVKRPVARQELPVRPRRHSQVAA